MMMMIIDIVCALFGQLFIVLVQLLHALGFMSKAFVEVCQILVLAAYKMVDMMRLVSDVCGQVAGVLSVPLVELVRQCPGMASAIYTVATICLLVVFVWVAVLTRVTLRGTVSGVLGIFSSYCVLVVLGQDIIEVLTGLSLAVTLVSVVAMHRIGLLASQFRNAAIVVGFVLPSVIVHGLHLNIIGSFYISVSVFASFFYGNERRDSLSAIQAITRPVFEAFSGVGGPSFTMFFMTAYIQTVLVVFLQSTFEAEDVEEMTEVLKWWITCFVVQGICFMRFHNNPYMLASTTVALMFMLAVPNSAPMTEDQWGTSTLEYAWKWLASNILEMYQYRVKCKSILNVITQHKAGQWEYMDKQHISDGIQKCEYNQKRTVLNTFVMMATLQYTWLIQYNTPSE